MSCYKIAIVLLVLLISTAQTAQAAPPQKLTSSGRQKMDPVMMNDGKSIIFTEEEKFNLWSLKRLTLATGLIEPLHAGAITSEFCASFSADGKDYAFLQNTANLHVKLVIQSADGSNKVEYDPGSGFAGIRNVSLAPDGSRVLFAFPRLNKMQQILSLNRSGKNLQELTAGDSYDFCPKYSPAGSRIVFASTRSGNFDIYVMSAGGTGLLQITNHKGLDTHPAWSPDGGQIAFTSLRQGNYDIYVVDADGTNLRRVTQDDERDDFACWHVDGKRLVVVSERMGRHDLYLVDVPQ